MEGALAAASAQTLRFHHWFLETLERQVAGHHGEEYAESTVWTRTQANLHGIGFDCNSCPYQHTLGSLFRALVIQQSGCK